MGAVRGHAALDPAGDPVRQERQGWLWSAAVADLRFWYLAAAGVGRIGIVDGDVVEVSNLQGR